MTPADQPEHRIPVSFNTVGLIEVKRLILHVDVDLTSINRGQVVFIQVLIVDDVHKYGGRPKQDGAPMRGQILLWLPGFYGFIN